MTRFIDPGLYGDPYADEPFLYGPLLSSINVLRIGQKTTSKNVQKAGEELDDIVEEGAEGGDAEAIRSERNIPPTGNARMKFFLGEEQRKNFTFEEGRVYECDFFNPYLDFNGMNTLLPRS